MTTNEFEEPIVSRRFVYVSLVLATVLGGAGWVWKVSTGKSEGSGEAHAARLLVDSSSVTISPDAPQWKYLELRVAEKLAPLPPLPAPGRVGFDEARTSTIASPLTGRLDAVLVRLGDSVRKGDPLLSIRSGAFAEASRELASAQEAVNVKHRVVERVRDLVNVQAAAQKELAAAEAELKEAELALRAAQAKRESLGVKSAGDNLFWVTAPRDGTIVDLDAFAGQAVSETQERPLLRISNLDEVLVLADVQEGDAQDLKVGAEVKIIAHGGSEPRDGKVSHISEVVDPQRRTVVLRILAKNADRVLRPNSFVEVALPAADGALRVRVPQEAVVSEGSTSRIFVASDAGRLQSTAVTLGRQRDGEVELRSGLEPGTRYVARGALLLLNQVDLAQ